MPRFDAADERFMRRALALAARGQGFVEPNPMVGCVLVRTGRVVGAGWHRRFGRPHAEVEALRGAGRLARGATAYVTLEPCCHWGKTPPCTDALIAAGVARVVAPLADPNPLVAGRGFAALRKAGICVDIGLLAVEAGRLNAPFLKRIRTGRPWVILKWAQSLDGKIATRTGDSKWISDTACRRDAHATRGRVDAILVGLGTVRADDPLLTCRAGRARRVATRVVLDAELRTPVGSRLVETAREVPTWLFCGRDADARRARALERAGCTIHRVPLARRRAAGGPRVSLAAVLDELGRHEMTNVLVEGGGAVLGEFFDRRLADELHIYVAPLLIGGRAAPGPLTGTGPARVADAVRLSEVELRGMGDGVLVRALLT